MVEPITKDSLRRIVAREGLKATIEGLADVVSDWGASIVQVDAYSRYDAERWNRDANKLRTLSTTLESPI